MHFDLTTTVIVAVVALVVGAIQGPTILKLIADVKLKAETDYKAVIADLTAAKTKAEAAVATAVADAKAELQPLITAAEARATAAETDLASLKRLFTPATQPSVVPAPQMPPATVQLTPAEQMAALQPPAPQLVPQFTTTPAPVTASTT